MKTSVFCALAASLALCAPALAQTQNNNAMQTSPETQAAAGPSENTPASQSHANALLTIGKLKQDLQKAGFTDVKVIADSFVVEAKDKQGNPTIMTLSPGGVFAISEINKANQEKQAKANPSSSSQTPTRQ